MSTHRFQPGDKVRVKSPTLRIVDLGLAPTVTYTVAHVDDFGKVSLRGDSRYFHPSHFELVMRVVVSDIIGRYGRDTDMPCYSLKDGEGDWWVYDEGPLMIAPLIDPAAEGVWHLLGDGGIYRTGTDEGVQAIADQYGIDGTPTAPAETYCLKDKDDDWWHSADGENFRLWSWSDRYTGTHTIEHIADLHGIDAEPIPAESSDAEDDDGEYETEMALAYEEPGNSTGPHLHFEAAPLQPGDWVKVLARVEQVFDNGSIRTQTFQSDGAPNGPRGFAIASAVTRTDEVPEWAKEPERPEEPTTLGAVVYSASAAKLYTRASICIGETHVWASNMDRCWYSWEQLPADAKVVDPGVARAEVTER